MKRKVMIIPITVIITLALVSAIAVVSLGVWDSLQPVGCVGPAEDIEVPPERIPPKNSFDNADLIIAFSSWDGLYTYQFK